MSEVERVLVCLLCATISSCDNSFKLCVRFKRQLLEGFQYLESFFLLAYSLQEG